MGINIITTAINYSFHLCKIFIYGEPKVGKTTLASRFPKPLFAACEPGHDYVEIDKVDCFKWNDIIEIVKYLASEENKKYKTLIIDTIDEAWKMCEVDFCKENELTHLSDWSFGKGYNQCGQKFHDPFKYLAKKGIGLVFISHSKEEEAIIKGMKKTRIKPTVANSALKTIRAMCDLIGYAYADDNEARKIIFKPHPNLYTGDRTGRLSEGPFPLDYDVLSEKFKQGSK